MSRKRLVKLLMSIGWSRNGANRCARKHIAYWGSYAYIWEAALLGWGYSAELRRALEGIPGMERE